MLIWSLCKIVLQILMTSTKRKTTIDKSSVHPNQILITLLQDKTSSCQEWKAASQKIGKDKYSLQDTPSKEEWTQDNIKARVMEQLKWPKKENSITNSILIQLKEQLKWWESSINQLRWWDLIKRINSNTIYNNRLIHFKCTNRKVKNLHINKAWTSILNLIDSIKLNNREIRTPKNEEMAHQNQLEY